MSPVQIRPPLPARFASRRSTDFPATTVTGTARWTLRDEEGVRRGQGHRRPAQDHHGLPGLQAPQLHHQEEPAQRPGPSRPAEVLPELRPAHRPPRDALRLAPSESCPPRPPARAEPAGVVVPGGPARAVAPVGGDALAVVRSRLRTQGLIGPGFADPAEVVRALGAVQAQEFPEMTWSLGERCRPSSSGLVAEAFDRGDFLRTHVLRPTWHVVAAEDLPWLLRLSAPRVHAVNATMYRASGAGPAERESAARLITVALTDGPRTRRELASHLSAG